MANNCKASSTYMPLYPNFPFPDSVPEPAVPLTSESPPLMAIISRGDSGKPDSRKPGSCRCSMFLAIRLFYQLPQDSQETHLLLHTDTNVGANEWEVPRFTNLLPGAVEKDAVYSGFDNVFGQNAVRVFVGAHKSCADE